jgi:hypothetical protein
MGRAIQVRGVPASVHARLRSRTADSGTSLSEFLLAQLIEFAAISTQAELREGLRSRKAVRLSQSAASRLRAERDPA